MPRPLRQSGRARFYHDIQLRGPIPSALLYEPDLPPRSGPALLEAVYDWAGQEDLTPQTRAGEDMLHRFDWLPILAATGAEGQDTMSQILHYWLDVYGRYTPAVWRPQRTAIRLVRMLGAIGPLTATADGPFRERIFDVIARQARHLGRILKGGKERTQITAILARTLASLCLPEDRQIGAPVSPRLTAGLRPIAQGSLPNAWRDPNEALETLEILLQVEAAFRARRLSPPAELAEAIKVARLYLGGLTGEDGHLLPLPGRYDPGAEALARVTPVRRPEAAALLEPMGYARLQSSASSMLTADLGTRQELFGTGAICLSVHGAPRIVNCGRPSRTAEGLLGRMTAWTEALSAPAATSGLDAVAVRPATAETTEENGVRHLVLTYPTGAGIVRRAFALGPDRLTAISRASSRDIYERLHLPYKTGIEIDGGEVHLIYADGVTAGLRVEGASVSRDESVGAWQDGTIVKTEQLILRPHADSFQWAFIWH